MAVERKISTRLVLEGEKEYRAAISGINNEYRLLQSRLGLVDSQFTGQKNTLAALEAKNKALNDVIANQASKLKAENDAMQNTKNLQAEYAKKAEEAKAKLEALNSSTDDATKGTQEYKDKVAELEKEYTRNIEASGKAADASDRHAINANKVQTTINKLNGELSKNDKYLDEAKASADGCAKSIDEMGNEAKQTADKSKDLGDKGKQGIEAIASALAAAGIAKGYKEIYDALMACVDASRQYESAMAGVAKTTNLAGPELTAMAGAIKETTLTIPITATELAALVQTGAQLAIPKDYLIGFAKVMADLGVATNLTSDEAATMLAQFANVTGLDPSKYSNLGSAIVALGNNFATNEKSIVEMSQRMAASGTIAGLTEPEILALATAMSSVGIEAEAGGSAMMQTLTAIEQAVAGGGEKLDQFAKVAGMSANEFATTWQTAPMQAIQAFLQGLGDLQEQGGSATLVLEEMGLSGVRQSGMLKGLSLASDQLSKATTLANKAWKENNALTKEAETRYATTDSKVKLFNNSVTALKISVGDQLTPALGELANTGKDVVAWAADFVEQNEWLAPAITGVVAALGALAASVVTVTVVIPALKAAWVALQGVMGPIGWISLAVGAVVGLGTAIAASVGSSKESIDGLTESAKDMPSEIASAQEEYDKRMAEIEADKQKADSLIETLSTLEQKATEGKLDASEWKDWNDTLSILVETVPELSQYIDLQTGSIKGGTKALEAYVSELDKMARQDAAVKALSGYYQAQADAQVNLTKSQNDYTTSYGNWKSLTSRRLLLLQQLGAASIFTSEEMKQLAESGSDIAEVLFPESMQDTVDAFNALSGETKQANDATSEYGETVKQNQTILDDSTTALETHKDALYGLTKAEGDAAGGADSLTQSQTDALTKFNDLKTQLDNLTTAYTTAYDNALQSINGIVSGFNKIELPDPKSINDLITALNSQNIYMDNYSGNLVKLEEIATAKGVQDSDAYQSLLEMLSNPTVDNAVNLQAIVDDGGNNLQMLLNQVSEVGKGKETFATVVAGMLTDFKEKSDAIQTEMKNLADKLNQSQAAGSSVRETMNRVNAELSAGATAVETTVDRINKAMASIGAVTYTEYTEGYNTGKPGGHAAGLPVVPADGQYYLHADEAVLTALQAKAYRAEQFATYNYPTIPVQSPATINAGSPIDYDRLGKSVAGAMEGFGVYLNHEKVGAMVTGTVSELIGEEIQRGRY